MDIKGTTIQHAADGISDFSEAGFARFGEQAKHLGFDEVLKRRWDPGVFSIPIPIPLRSRPLSSRAVCGLT